MTRIVRPERRSGDRQRRVLDAKVPPVRSRSSGTATSSTPSWSTRPTSASYEIIVVGTGLAGASAAATLAELGYKVKAFTFHDSPRRAHSIAAQGGINAAKNYRGDGDSIYRLFYDTVKGGDYRSREANVYRLAEVSRRHHRPVRGPGRALRPRVRRPARQPLLRRRPGVAARSTPGARPASSCCSAPTRRWPSRSAWATSSCTTACEMLDVVVVDGRCAGIVVRDLADRRDHLALRPRRGAGHRRLLQRLLPVDQRHGAATPPRSGGPTGAARYFANPCFTQIHPTCIPQSDEFQSKLTLMSESLRNDGRIWVPKDPDDTRSPTRSPRTTATTSSSASTRPSATSCRATSPAATPRR